MIRATLGEPLPLQVLLPDGQVDLYVRATVLDSAGAQVADIFLPHQQLGLYSELWTPTVEGYYSVLYDVYADPACTIPAGYDRDGEQVDVNSDKINIMRLLGLQHENAVVDQQTYSVTGKLLTARVRAYDNAANATLKSTQGLRYSWVMQAQYASGTDQLISYRILRGDA